MGGELKPVWFSTNPAKRWGEKFFLCAAVYWLLAMAVVLVTGAYENWHNLGYFNFGLVLALPFALYPAIFPADIEKNIPITQRYWLKANVWIFIFGFIGNYFWTHYFYKLLGAAYTIPHVTWSLNEVPLVMYSMTHAYFLSYHAMTTPLLRRYWTGTQPGAARWAGGVLLVIVLALFTAFMETLTIASFPYYVFKDRDFMYTVGTTFYALYFLASFPMFALLDESPRTNWSLADTAKDALAAGMIVFIMCDFWRLLACAWMPTLSASCPVPFA